MLYISLQGSYDQKLCIWTVANGQLVTVPHPDVGFEIHALEHIKDSDTAGASYYIIYH